MSRNSCFRLSFEKEHGKRLPKQLKYQRQQLHHIYCSTLRNFSCKKSLLVICKILRLFVNIQSSDDKHSLLTRGNLRESIQIQFSLKERTFTKFFSAISRSSINFEHFQKKMTLIAVVFLSLRTLKNVVRSMPKKSNSGYHSKSNVVNGSQHC